MESKICLTGTMFAWCIDELLVDSKLWPYHGPLGSRSDLNRSYFPIGHHPRTKWCLGI